MEIKTQPRVTDRRVTSIVAAQEGGVAFWAHLGGFLAGVTLVKLFERSEQLAAHRWRARRKR